MNSWETVAKIASNTLGVAVVLLTAWISYWKVLRPSKRANGRLSNVETTLSLWESRVDVLERDLADTRRELSETNAELVVTTRRSRECEEDRSKLQLEMLDFMRKQSLGGSR